MKYKYLKYKISINTYKGPPSSKYNFCYFKFILDVSGSKISSKINITAPLTISIIEYVNGKTTKINLYVLGYCSEK